jgi:hypothetical protein
VSGGAEPPPPMAARAAEANNRPFGFSVAGGGGGRAAATAAGDDGGSFAFVRAGGLRCGCALRAAWRFEPRLGSAGVEEDPVIVVVVVVADRLLKELALAESTLGVYVEEDVVSMPQSSKVGNSSSSSSAQLR